MDVIIAFMLFQTRNSLVLLLGAIVVGYIAFVLINWIHKYSHFAPVAVQLNKNHKVYKRKPSQIGISKYF